MDLPAEYHNGAMVPEYPAIVAVRCSLPNLHPPEAPALIVR
jgi:hypothetical protein